jgi:hypothetical protein
LGSWGAVQQQRPGSFSMYVRQRKESDNARDQGAVDHAPLQGIVLEAPGPMLSQDAKLR